eukprot:2646880-Lingulodinium_polyedra.AAC.1
MAVAGLTLYLVVSDAERIDIAGARRLEVPEGPRGYIGFRESPASHGSMRILTKLACSRFSGTLRQRCATCWAPVVRSRTVP